MSLLNGSPQIQLAPISEDLLYTITTYTDGIAGSLQVRRYVDFHGNRVISKPDSYFGSTTIHTNRGPLTVTFEIEAFSGLHEAFQNWHAAAVNAIQKTIGDIQSQALRSTILSPGGKGQ